MNWKPVSGATAKRRESFDMEPIESYVSHNPSFHSTLLPETALSSNHLTSLSRRRGGVTPLTVLSLSLLVGTAALVVDSGTLLEARRHVQAAADAAALAGANDLYANYVANQGIDKIGSARQSALVAAAANGFDYNDVQTTSITVTTSPNPYQGGPNAGKPLPAGYIEVIIQYNANHLFSGVFGSGTTPVRARAVARGRTVPQQPMDLIALNLNLAAALNVSSVLGGLLVQNGIQVNSGNPSAVEVSLLAKITTPLLNLNSLVGGLVNSILSFLLGSSTVTTSPPIADPLRYLPDPDPTQLSTAGSNVSYSSGIQNLYPGVYNGGIQISNSATVILHDGGSGTPGIYYLNGPNGFQVLGNANVKMALGETGGIMIYNNWADSSDAVNITTNGTVKINPPANGKYRGVSIFQKRGTTSQAGPTVSISGQANLQLTGTIYAAYAIASLSGTSSTNITGGQLIADTVNVSGSATVNIKSGGQPTANMRILGLVE